LRCTETTVRIRRGNVEREARAAAVEGANDESGVLATTKMVTVMTVIKRIKRDIDICHFHQYHRRLRHYHQWHHRHLAVKGRKEVGGNPT